MVGRLPVSHYRSPQEVSPADNLPAKICPARRPPGRDGFLLGIDFFGGRSYSEETFYGTGDFVLIKNGDITNPWLYLPGGFFMGRHFNVSPAGSVSAACWQPASRRRPSDGRDPENNARSTLRHSTHSPRGAAWVIAHKRCIDEYMAQLLKPPTSDALAQTTEQSP